MRSCIPKAIIVSSLHKFQLWKHAVPRCIQKNEQNDIRDSLQQGLLREFPYNHVEHISDQSLSNQPPNRYQSFPSATFCSFLIWFSFGNFFGCVFLFFTSMFPFHAWAMWCNVVLQPNMSTFFCGHFVVQGADRSASKVRPRVHVIDIFSCWRVLFHIISWISWSIFLIKCGYSDHTIYK